MADQRDGGIAWSDETWNPIRGCSRVSEGCARCYAETVAARFSGPGLPYEGLAKRNGKGEARWTGAVRMVPEHLADPLRWKRPRRVFVNSMSDLFHEKLTDNQIAAVFGVMAASPQHTFQVLTKRAGRMLEWFRGLPRTQTGWCQAMAMAELRGDPARLAIPTDLPWPLPNVWLGVSAENQATADERIPLLLECPAAVRWVSYEPALGPLVLAPEWSSLSWLVAGGESGPGARPCDVRWIRSIIEQCRTASVACFTKQMGARLVLPGAEDLHGSGWGEHVVEDDGAADGADRLVRFDRNGKGGDPSEWPEDLRVREYPR